jgi:hypothetical protein
MEAFNYASPGELYYPSSKIVKRPPHLTYRRFSTAAEALRFAIEGIPALFLQGCFMEVDGERYGANQIRELYDSAQYPLPRMEA